MAPVSDSRVIILGIPVDAVTGGRAIQILRGFLASPGRHHVMTPNNEMLVRASEDPAFARLLRSADLNLADSTGLLWAARQTGQYLPERVTGVDTVERLCGELGPETPVFLLGAAPGVAEKAAEALRRKNPRLNIRGTLSGSPSPSDAPTIVETINASAAALLLVAFGAPAQDRWIADHLSAMPSVRVAIGVGGTLDFLASVQIRAPRWMQKIGLEWLWRFIQQPTRARRMWNAVIVFPWLILRYGRNGPGR